MANPHRGELAFEAGGKSYTLHYTQNSLVELEEELDQGIVSIISDMQGWGKDPKLIRLSRMRALLWAGLRKNHPEITMEGAGDVLQEVGSLTEAMILIGSGIEKAFNAPEVAETKGARPRQQAANGTGASSSSTSSALDTTRPHSGTSRPGK